MPQKIDFQPVEKEESPQEEIQFEPIDFQPIEEPSPTGGHWEQRGPFHKMWVPDVQPDLENRPDTQVFDWGNLFQGARESLDKSPIVQAFPKFMHPVNVTEFVLGNMAAPDAIAGGLAGLLKPRGAARAPQAIIPEIVSETPRPSIRGLLPERTATAPPDYIAGPTGKAMPYEPSVAMDVHDPRISEVASPTIRGEGGRFQNPRPVYSGTGQAIPEAADNLPSAQKLVRILENNKAAEVMESTIKEVPTAAEMPKHPVQLSQEFNIGGKLEEKDIRELSDYLANHPDLGPAESSHAILSLAKIAAGKKPTRNEYKMLGHVLGRDTMRRIVLSLPDKPTSKWNVVADYANLPRAIQASMDFSYPLRQGIGLIHKGAWWKSWGSMFRSWGSEKTYQGIMDSILHSENFKPRAIGNKIYPSYAEEAGLSLTDLSHITRREEAMMSNLAETGGNIPYVSAAWKKTAGRGVRASNRAFTAFANKLRADTFNSMIKDARVAYTSMKKTAKGAEELAKIELMDPDSNLALRKAIAGYINDASGRGSLGNLEKHATALNTIFFSPRLIASRVNMVKNAAFAHPGLRREYVKSLTALAGFWSTMGVMGTMAGGKMSFDPFNSDFLKLRFGNVRLDPGAGFQQYAVVLSRLAPVIGGYKTSSTTGETHKLGSKFGSDTRGDVLRRFVAGKTNPFIKSAHDYLFESRDYQPYNLADETVKMVAPFILQDLVEIYKEDPRKLPLMVPVTFGMGTQTYDREKEATFIGEGGLFEE